MLANANKYPVDEVKRLRELEQVKEGLRQLEATRAEEEQLTALFKLVQEMEPLLVSLTIRAGKTIATIESALVLASLMDPDTLLFDVRLQLEWLIAKSEETEREIRDAADAAYKLQFVQNVANAQLAGWLQVKPVWRDSIERLTKPSVVGSIALAIGLLFLMFAFPPLGIGLSAAISIPMAYSSVKRAMQLWLSGTRLAQYGFEPLVSKEDNQAAMLQAWLDVVFALLDIGVLTAAGIKGVRLLKAHLARAQARSGWRAGASIGAPRGWVAKARPVASRGDRCDPQ